MTVLSTMPYPTREQVDRSLAIQRLTWARLAPVNAGLPAVAGLGCSKDGANGVESGKAPIGPACARPSSPD